jgi:hypothetical protein
LRGYGDGVFVFAGYKVREVPFPKGEGMKSGCGYLLSLFVSNSKKWYALYIIMPSQYLPTFPS